MINDDVKQKVEMLAKKVIEAAGMDLIELKVAGRKNDVHIKITADKSNGGITIRECAILNRSLVATIEQENVLPPEFFSLELSSPGLDRPLVSRKDFMRVIGRQLHFWLNEPIGGKKEVQGILNEVGESSLTVDVSGKFKQVLALSSIIKGMLVI